MNIAAFFFVFCRFCSGKIPMNKNHSFFRTILFSALKFGNFKRLHANGQQGTLLKESSLFGCVKGLLQIFNQIVRIFKSQGKANRFGVDVCRRLQFRI